MKKLLLLLCGLLFVSTVVIAQEKEKDDNFLPPASLGPLPDGVPKAQKRLEWFYGARATPDGYIEPGGMNRAWRQSRDMKVYHNPDNLYGKAPDWEFMGPTSLDIGGGAKWLGRVHDLVIDRTNPSRIWIGHSKGGVWRSIDAGTTWTNLTDFLSSQVSGCLTQDPVDPNTIYFGTGEEYFATRTLSGAGIWKSTDGGNTWTLFGASTFTGRRLSDIVINPANPNQWLVTADNGVYKTTDGGATFSLKLSGTATAMTSTAAGGSWSNLVCAIGWFRGDAANGVYRSTNGGDSWTLQTGGGLWSGAGRGRIELAPAPSAAGTIYAVYSEIINNGSLIAGVWKSTDGGVNWVQKGTPLSPYGQGWYDLCIAVSPTDPNTLLVGDTYLWRSTDGGATFSDVTGDHTDNHIIRYLDANKVYLGLDAGLYYSTDGGLNWTNKNSNRGTMEFYSFDVHPTNPAEMTAGSQDNATQTRRGDNANWEIQIGGDGFWVAYKKTDGNMMLGEVYYANVYQTYNSGASWNGVFDGGGDPANWSSPIRNNPVTPSTFYVGTNRVWRSTSNGDTGTWTALTGSALTGGTLTGMDIGADGQTIVTGGSDGQVWVSSNNGTTWTNRSAGLPAYNIGGISIDRNNPNRILISCRRYATDMCWSTFNGGATWTNVTNNLPAVASSDCIISPLDSNTFVVATDIGPFVSRNAGATWERLGSNFPTTLCTSLRANVTTGYLTIGTFGRGLWRTPIPRNVSASGALNLEGADAAYPGHTIFIDVMEPGTSTVVRTDTVALPAAKTYSVAVGNGTWDLRFRAKKYLWKKVSVNTTNGSVVVPTPTLLAGDIDFDNEVTILDYSYLSDYFDKSSTDSDWNVVGSNGYRPTDTDLDWDGAVSILDYSLLSDNFDRRGD